MILKLLFVLLLLASVRSEQVHNLPAQEEQGPHYHSITDKQFWINTLLAIFFCCLAGFCSGNTVGMLSIDPLQLQIKMMNGTAAEKKQAELILKVLKDHHLLLVTLLLYNAIAMESLPLVIHTLVPAWLAILLSTCVVLIVGQIIPQALCTGPRKLQIAEKTAPIILVMIKIFWILSYPMSKGLDYLLGQHGHHRLQRKDLAALLKNQDQSTLKCSQILILGSILKLREQKVPKVMIPIGKAYIVDSQQKLDKAKVQQFRRKQFSFIPIFKGRRSKIVGIIKTKQLVTLMSDKNNIGKRVCELFGEDKQLLTIYQDTNLMQLLMLFQAKKARIALVANIKKKIQPGINSIYYSKSDMILENGAEDVQIIGIAFLNMVFQELAGIEDSGQATGAGSELAYVKQEREMEELKKPLIRKE